MKREMATIIAGTVVAITGVTLSVSATVLKTTGQDLMGRQQETLLLAANSSVIIKDKISCTDIKALRDNSSDFALYFDPPHAEKIRPRLEVNAFLSDSQRLKLGRDYSETFSKFRFGTREVQENKNRLKFEVGNFADDVGKDIGVTAQHAWKTGRMERISGPVCN